MLEAAELYKENNLSCWSRGAKVHVDKIGLYEFNADQPAVRVLDGEATVHAGDADANLEKRASGFDRRRPASQTEKL